MSNKKNIIYVITLLAFFTVVSCTSVKDIPSELKKSTEVQSYETLKYRGAEISIADIFNKGADPIEFQISDDTKEVFAFSSDGINLTGHDFFTDGESCIIMTIHNSHTGTSFSAKGYLTSKESLSDESFWELFEKDHTYVFPYLYTSLINSFWGMFKNSQIYEIPYMSTLLFQPQLHTHADANTVPETLKNLEILHMRNYTEISSEEFGKRVQNPQAKTFSYTASETVMNGIIVYDENYTVREISFRLKSETGYRYFSKHLASNEVYGFLYPVHHKETHVGIYIPF